MSLAKRNLLRTNHLYIHNYLRSKGHQLTTCHQITANFGHEIADVTDIPMRPIIVLSLSTKQTLQFHSLKQVFQAVDNLSANDLLKKYGHHHTYSNHLNFPLTLLLQNLSPKYTLEKIQFFSLEKTGRILETHDLDTVLSHFIENPKNTESEHLLKPYDESYLYDYVGQLMYQLRDKKTGQIVSTAIPAKDLPMAVYTSKQTCFDTHDDYFQRTSWNLNYVNLFKLSIDRPEQLISDFRLDHHDVKRPRNAPFDPRKPIRMDKRIIANNDFFYPEYHVLKNRTESGLYPDDFISLSGYDIFVKRLIQQALDRGWQFWQYNQRETDVTETTLENARIDTEHQNYRAIPHIKPTYTFFEIIDSKTNKVLATQIGQQDFNNRLLKLIWEHEE